MFLGRKSCCSGTRFGDDLLRRINSQAGHLSQPLNWALVRAEQIGHLLLELVNPLFERCRLFQRHVDEPPVYGVQLLTHAECIAQLFGRGAQALISRSGQRRWTGFPVGDGLKHRRALTPRRSETRLDNLICASSSRASNVSQLHSVAR